ncbi:hypothetical protein ACFLW6_01685, partial [Chloroflexota bacterium]
AGTKIKRKAEEARAIAETGVEKASTADEVVSTDLYEGMVELTIASPVDYKQMKRLEESLAKVENIRVVLVGGSVDEGSKILLAARKPIPLLSVLSEMSLVEQAVKKGKDIWVTLVAKDEAS